jgi:small conductance mechanosensitive channel
MTAVAGPVLAARLLPETEKLAEMGVRIAVALVVAFLAQRLLFLVGGRAERWMVRAGRGGEYTRQRAHTLGQIFRNLCTVFVVGAAALYVLGVMGWDVRPILAGAGILGVALGFGAQTLVRDVIAGVFILAEDQFAVGDLIEVGGKAATVEALTVRSTTLRDFNGYLHFVPNGEMRVVVNRSRGWHRLAVDVPVAADEDVERALGVCRRVVEEFNGDGVWRPRLLEPVAVWGVESLSGQEAQIRIVVRSQPGPDAPESARELRRRVHRALKSAGLRLSPSREIALSPLPASTAASPAT